MPRLEFNLAKSFDENMEAFKQHVMAMDPVLGAIFLKHIATLQAGDDPSRNRAARTAFNRAVLTDLESLQRPSELPRVT